MFWVLAMSCTVWDRGIEYCIIGKTGVQMRDICEYAVPFWLLTIFA